MGLKVLHISLDAVNTPVTASTGGLSIHVMELAKAQARMGWDVSVIAYDTVNFRHWKGMVDGVDVLICQNTNIHGFSFRPHGPYTYSIIMDILVENYAWHMHDKEWDVICVHDTLLFSFAKWVKIFQMKGGTRHVPLILTCHLSHCLNQECPVDNESLREQWFFEASNEANAHSLATSRICVSDKYTDQLGERFKYDTPITTISNGINFEDLQQYSSNQEIHDRYAQGRKLVVFVGRFVPTKGLQAIYQAVQRFPRRYSFVLISFMAPHIHSMYHWANKYDRLCEEWDNVFWLKHLPSNDERKWKIWASADLFIAPSTHEPDGLVAKESAALRVPRMVSTEMSHQCDNTNAWMIEPTPEGLIKGLDEWEPDDARVEKAWLQAKENTWDKVATRTSEVYMEALDRWRQR